MKIFTKKTVFNIDTLTPVGMFLNLRNHFSKIALLESNDYHERSELKSFIGFNPLAEIRIENFTLKLFIKNEIVRSLKIDSETKIIAEIDSLQSEFNFDLSLSEFNGFFGFVGFEFSHFIENHIQKRKSDLEIPDFQVYLFENIIVLDHFKNTGFILENSFENDFSQKSKALNILLNKSHTPLYFEKVGDETSSLTDENYKSLVTKAKEHCLKGDVFQLVLSRDFSQPFFGDDFEVYRSLRRLNPSPYLFYFDFETHRILGSSPEAQLKITKKNAEIHPIAGTVKKTGDILVDEKSISFLISDKKENAEHTMLVDLARNDLSKSCKKVKVEHYKEIQQFSHVIHLVSKVSGELKAENSTMNLFADTFPAGTLSGTPKPKALELISKYENKTRDYYGGAIGFLSAAGDLNFAIIIRSILSKNNLLHYRAGAGIVIHSDEASELNEINNKLAAVRKAIELAENKILSL